MIAIRFAFSLPGLPGAGRRTRRTAMLAGVALVHLGLLVMMLRANLPAPEVSPEVVNVAFFAAPTPPPHAPAHPVAPKRRPEVASRISPPMASAGPRTVFAPNEAPALVILPAAAPASAASAPPPLVLTLTPVQLQAIARAGDDRTSLRGEQDFAGLAAAGAETEKLHLKALPHGVNEVRVHGNCYRLVPSLRSQFDPFNHANETLIAPC